MFSLLKHFLDCVIDFKTLKVKAKPIHLKGGNMHAAGNVSSTILNTSYVAKTAPITTSFLIIPTFTSYSDRINWGRTNVGLYGNGVSLEKNRRSLRTIFPGINIDCS